MPNLNDSTTRSTKDRPSEAVWWFTRRGRASDWSSEDEAAFQAWLHENPEHETAYREVTAVFEASGDAVIFATDPAREPLERDDERRFAPAGLLAVAAGLAIAALIGVAVLRQPDTPAPFSSASYHTATGELGDVTLDDGSRVSLDTATELTVRYTTDSRDIRLKSGRAIFDVTHDSQRPFVVRSGGCTVRVLGTRFEVSRHGERLEVRVDRGAVAVWRAATDDPASPPQAVNLASGQQLAVSSADQFSPVERFQIERFGLWRDGQLAFHDEPLEAVVAEVNRYFTQKLVVRDPDLRQRRVGGVFYIRDLGEFLLALEQTLPVEAERVSDQHIVITPRSQAAVR